jgi:hypothetical protein
VDNFQENHAASRRSGTAFHPQFWRKRQKIEAFCGNEIDSLAKLRADTIYLPTENPLLRAILLPLGGIGILELANGIAPYLK